MKKKSFFGLNAKLALMLVAICGMFVSCYEKEELTVEAPSTVAPVYSIEGIITDASTGEAINGASVAVTGGASTTTGTDGKYQMKATEGLNVITVSKGNDYVKVQTSIFVKAIANGQTATYPVNVALNPGKNIPDYKTVEYVIKGTVVAEDGTAVKEGLKVIIAGQTATIKDNTFEVSKVTPGTYQAVITATGYEKAYASINVAPVAAEEGEKDQIQTAVSSVSVIMQKTEVTPVEPAKYYVCAYVRNAKNANVNGATVAIKIGNADEVEETTDNYGYVRYTVPADVEVGPTTLAVITVTKSGYVAQSKAAIMPFANAGETSVTTIEMVLVAEGADVPEEDPSTTTPATVTVDTEKATAYDPEKVDEDTKKAIEEIAQSTGSDLSDAIAVEATVAIPTTLTSTEAVVDEATGETTQQTVTVADQITVPAGTTILYTSAAGGAQNLTITRDMTTEKTTASTRTYSGEPSGVIFSKPLEINFPSPIAIADKPDFMLGVLYEKDGVWSIEKGNYAKYNTENGVFEGKINHFSKFRFGYEVEINDNVKGAVLDSTYFAKSCFTGSAAAVVTVKGSYVGGFAYVEKTPQMVVDEALASCKQVTKDYVRLLLLKMIKADNANILPNNNYSAQTFQKDINVAAYTQIKGFTLKRTETRKSYTVNVILTDESVVPVTVTVKRVSAYTLEADKTINHSHGHGNGEDLNAGGGIIDFE